MALDRRPEKMLQWARILPSLCVVPLKLKDILHKPGAPIRGVFPGGGLCSMLTVLEDGGMVEFATIGRDGMVGSSSVLDGTPVTSAAMVQRETDTCYRMNVDAFGREIERLRCIPRVDGPLHAGILVATAS